MSPTPYQSASFTAWNGRLLQAATTTSEPTLGVGLVLLIVFGILALLACILASGRGAVTRVTVVLSSTLCYGSLAMVLLLLPRELRLPDTSGRMLVSDGYSLFLRVLFLVVVRLPVLAGHVRFVACLAVPCLSDCM